MRFCGEVGYGNSVESPPGSGVWKDVITEYPYIGDVIRNTRRLVEGESLNSNISVGNSISVVADQYAFDNVRDIRYVRWNGSPWIVDSVEVQRPRLILNLGKVYNGPTP